MKQGSTESLYLPRSVRGGGGGLGFKITKIKAAVNIKGSTDPTMGLVREFEEKAAQAVGRSVVKDQQTFAEELWMDLKLQHPDPNSHTVESDRIETPEIEDWIKKEVQSNR